MSGPIIRSGASAQYSENWGSIFSGGRKKKSAAKPAPAAKTAPKKSAKKKTAKAKKK